MSACRWQADERIIAHCGDGLKGHVSGPLDGPFVVLFKQQCADEADDGAIVGEDADDLGAPLDLAIESLDGIGAVKLGPVLPGKGHIGEHVFFSGVHELGELRHFLPDLVGDVAPLSACGLRRILGEGRGDEGGDHSSAALSGMGQGVSHEVNPGAVEKGLSF